MLLAASPGEGRGGLGRSRDALLSRLSVAEAATLYTWLEKLTATGKSESFDIVPLLLSHDASSALKTLAVLVWRCRGDFSASGLAGSGLALADELSGLRSALLGIACRDPGSWRRISAGRADCNPSSAVSFLPQLDDVAFLFWLYRSISLPQTSRRAFLEQRLDLSSGRLDRQNLANSAFVPWVHGAAPLPSGHRPDVFHIMGTGQRVSREDWDKRVLEAAALPLGGTDKVNNRFQVEAAKRRRVSFITSLYRGGRFIERFLANITGQNGFREHAELIVIDADSPDGEHRFIAEYQQRFDNIKYLRLDYRCGIYQAWNIAIRMAEGEFLTNANVDDLRRQDALELQLASFDNLPFLDVVYQDFYYSLDPEMSFEQVARVGYRSDLPLVTQANLFHCNPPHNAPMWRKSLHDELGMFDESLESAGDYEFWMRCVFADKVFYKLNQAVVAYYQNPQGISTRIDTRGHSETREIHRRYQQQLLGPLLRKEFDAFCREELAINPDLDDGRQDRLRMLRCAKARALAILDATAREMA